MREGEGEGEGIGRGGEEGEWRVEGEREGGGGGPRGSRLRFLTAHNSGTVRAIWTPISYGALYLY